jgi:diguanylate cyclase (GGDEF)-like protein
MKQILVVDDSETSILYIQLILRDYEVIFALNGKEMWERLNESSPVLILMDVMLPDANGYELVKQLSKTEKYKDIPIIFQTAKSSGDDLEKGFESGAVDYIRKPVDKKELKARVKSVLKIKELENELYQKSITDYLTGIYNRRHFFEIAAKHLSFCQTLKKNLSIALLDIDFFKKINDTYGHDAGDFVLKKFAEIIGQTKRSNDILARYGGEEFILLFFETDKSEALKILISIQNAIVNEKIVFNEFEIECTFSCGLVDLQEFADMPRIDDLIRDADKRMYTAKLTGRNRIIYEG